MSFLKRKPSVPTQKGGDGATSASAAGGKAPPANSDAASSASLAKAPRPEVELSASGAQSLARASSALDASSVPASVLGAENDVQFYLDRISKIVDEYQRLYKKAQDLKKLSIPRNTKGIPYKKLRDEKAGVLTKRKELKEEFIKNKQLARVVMKDRLPPERVGLRERELKNLQQNFREYDSGIKELDLLGEAKGAGTTAGGLKTAGSASSGLAMLAGVDTARSGDSSIVASSRSDGSSGASGGSRLSRVLKKTGSAVASVLPIPHGSTASAASSASSVAIAIPGSAVLDDDQEAGLDAAAAAAKAEASYVVGVGEDGDDELWAGSSSSSGPGGGTGLKGSGRRPLGAPKTNSDYLGDALDIQKDTLEKLREGQKAIEQSKAVGGAVTETLQEDHEKIERISTKLDEVQSELQISRKLLVNFLKKLYTDKIIIALSFLIVCAIVAIVILSVVKKDQKVFNVPDILKPPLNNNKR
jgi:hypothetical protein